MANITCLWSFNKKEEKEKRGKKRKERRKGKEKGIEKKVHLAHNLIPMGSRAAAVFFNARPIEPYLAQFEQNLCLLSPI